MSDELRDEASEPNAPDPIVGAQQDQHLRRIMVSFLVVILLVPIVALGGSIGALLLLPLLAVGAFALREAMRLRRSVRLHGDARMR